MSHTLRHHVGAGRHRRPAWQRRAARGIALAFMLVVAWLVVNRARQVDWPAVREALLAYPGSRLAVVSALAVLSYSLYACYDLIGRRYVRHRISVPKVMGVGLVSYAFNLNLGTLIGAVGLRWRLYSRLGLRQGQIGRVVALSVVTNWSGYLLLAGAVLAVGRIHVPPGLPLTDGVVQGVGLVMMTLGALYVALCARAKRRHLTVRGHAFHLPSGRMAMVQIAVSAANWSTMALIVWLLLPPGVGYGPVLGTLLIAAVAGLIVRVPAGLGVIEAVFIALLGGALPEGPLIAALLAYRGLYYLLPLALAAALHFGLEAAARRHKAASHHRH